MYFYDKWVECSNCKMATDFAVIYENPEDNEIVVSHAMCLLCGWTTRAYGTKIKRLELGALRQLGFTSLYGQRAEAALKTMRWYVYQFSMDNGQYLRQVEDAKKMIISSLSLRGRE